jgi:hypothetical protein
VSDERYSRARKLEALYPAFAAGLVILVYISTFALFVTNCGDGNSGRCSKVEIATYLAAHGRCASADGAPPLTPDERAMLWSGRLPWLFFVALNNIVNAFVIFISIHLIGRTASGRNVLGRFTRRPGRRAAVGVLLLALASFAAWNTDHRWLMPQMDEVLRCTVRVDLPSVDKLAYLTNLLTLLATGCFVAATCAVLWPAERARRRREADLARRLNLLRLLLYVGAASLVAYILRMSFTMNWAMLHVAPALEKDAAASVVANTMGSFASAFVTTQAGATTLLLAATYVPAVLVLRRRAEALVGRRLAPQEREEWLKTRGLSASLSEYLPRLAAILGPLLAGPLGDLLGRLSR